MVQINFALKEVNCKIVYYGPGLSGKTTNLEVVHSKAPKSHTGELTSIATEGDRTLFFDFLPLSLGKVAGMNTKFQIYTVPGQVYYNSTRKLVLQGADGIVFVADSRRSKLEENLESLRNLEENLTEYGMDIHSIPLVIQYNKRDMDGVMSIEELEAAINTYNAPYFEAVAVKGEGVFPTLKKLSSMVLEHLNQQHGSARVQQPPAREPALVGQAASGAAARSPATGAAAPRPAARPGGARPRPKPVSQQRGGRKVKEPVSGSAGVKAIERTVPAARRSRPNAAPAAPVGRRSGGSKAGLVIAAILVVLAAAGAAVYFTGIWKKFL